MHIASNRVILHGHAEKAVDGSVWPSLRLLGGQNAEDAYLD
jgi:hypothetical protein